ncbi:hypothetical protein Q4595_11255 [Wenyingzhuangia sp. 1_MG-2023]|nr:hypothetical protein [Wenyingzhuangia sp. 1_MG-2023]
MNRVLIIIFLGLFISFSCSNKKTVDKEIIAEQFNLSQIDQEEYISTPRTFSKKEYFKEVNTIIHNGRASLQDSLPFYIENIKNLILSNVKQKKRIVSGSIGKHDSIVVKQLKECDAIHTFNYLDYEFRVNLLYDEILNELDALNADYYNYYTTKNKDFDFLSYHEEALPIVLAEEVTWKLDEYNHLEEERNKKQNIRGAIQGGIMMFELIPGASLCTKIMQGVKYGAVAANNTRKVSKRIKGSKRIAAVIISKVVGKRKALKIVKSLSNEEKIRRYSRVSERAVWVGTGFNVTDMGYDLFLEKNEASIEEKINEFSAGMIAVYMQQLREISKQNLEKIKLLENE